MVVPSHSHVTKLWLLSNWLYLQLFAASHGHMIVVYDRLPKIRIYFHFLEKTVPNIDLFEDHVICLMTSAKVVKSDWSCV